MAAAAAAAAAAYMRTFHHRLSHALSWVIGRRCLIHKAIDSARGLYFGACMLRMIVQLMPAFR
jgi:hypothetical protein